MTDVSKAIYSGDWELYPREGRVEIQDFAHPKIVLTDAEADAVRDLLNERERRKVAAIHIVDLNVEEKIFDANFADMPELEMAHLMIEAMINAGYRMIIYQSPVNRDRWRALINRWRSVKE